MDAVSLALGGHDAAPPIPARELTSVEPGLVRRYEDYVLGKLYADLAFERGSDALARYGEEDRPRGVAYLAERMLARVGLGGTIVNPAAIRTLREVPPAEVLEEAWQLLAAGLPAEVAGQLAELVDCMQSTGELLGPEGATTVGAGAQWTYGFLANRCLTIAGGTSEIQRNVIGERLLGLPRDP